ncbi:MAG: hypothetical protein ACFBSG_17010 [Leptolyngbyaceae cyanobacterium]
MSFSRPPSRIQPKISTMPRQQSESSRYLAIYKLTIEKKRLYQELASLEKRRDRIETRLQALEQEIAILDHQAHHANDARREPARSLSEPNSVVYPPTAPSVADNGDDFNTLTLDY